MFEEDKLGRDHKGWQKVTQITTALFHAEGLRLLRDCHIGHQLRRSWCQLLVFWGCFSHEDDTLAHSRMVSQHRLNLT